MDQPRTNDKTILVGAGVSTLSAAHRLQGAGAEYELFESTSEIGGLCQTVSTRGFTYDTVSHVLHIRSPEAQKLLEDILERECVHVERSSAVYFKGRCIPFPFQAHLGFLPGSDRFRAFAGLLWASATRSRKKAPDNLAEWIETHYGSAVAELFMGPYNQKLWGVPTGELSTDWVGSFVPSTSIAGVLRSFFGHRSQMGYNARFSYPREGGIGSLVHKLAAPLRPIHFNKQLTSVNVERREVRFGEDQPIPFADLVTCIPLKQLAELTADLPLPLQEVARTLRSTSVLSLIYCLDRPLPHGHHWIYYHESTCPFFRLFFPSNIHAGMAPKGCSIIAAEVSNPAPSQVEALERKTRKKLQELGLLKDDASIVHRSQHFYPHGYPVHDLKRQDTVKQLLGYYHSKRVWPIGRFGAWYYSSVDDAIAEGTQVAEKVIGRQESNYSAES